MTIYLLDTDVLIRAKNEHYGFDLCPGFWQWLDHEHAAHAGLVQSLGTVGDAYDNAVVESLWGRMPTELLNTRKWKTRVELSTAIFDWIEVFYNRQRRHSALGNIAPVEFERRRQQQPKPPDSHNRSPTSGRHITWAQERVPLNTTSIPRFLAAAAR